MFKLFKGNGNGNGSTNSILKNPLKNIIRNSVYDCFSYYLLYDVWEIIKFFHGTVTVASQQICHAHACVTSRHVSTTVTLFLLKN